MIEKIIEGMLEVLIPVCEGIGIVVAAVSAVTAFYHYLRGLFGRDENDVKFQLASGLALSLEFKMAAEILKTVIIRGLQELLILGAVIVLRGLLTLLIHFEMKRKETKTGDERI